MNPITTNFGYTGNVQTYNVTVTGSYDLSGFGAGGGAGTRGVGAAGGSGAEIGGTFNLTAGQQLFIIVGGAAANDVNGNAAGGGGFSEIYTRDANNNITPLLIAGGGGGGGGNGGTAGANASVGAIGSGAGGSAGTSNFGLAGAGGAGATSNGADGNNAGGAALGGQDAANGAAGGAGYQGSGTGGFGGGGGGAGGGGGGGGYTGGIGGNGPGNTGGGGGTSYISNTGVQNFAETMSGNNVSRGSGSVRILAPAQPAAPCYVTGSRIRVLRGRTIADVPVERLRVGDLALTASGRPRPIRWIGSRSYPGLTAPQADRPVRIAADALSPGVPARDLLVSPDHALMLDGLFVAAGHLVNGETIIRGEAVTDLIYWHVELDSHDLLMAENTPAESYLAAPGVRAGFDGIGADDGATAPLSYAPRAERHTPEMDALRERLILRAGLSIEPTRFGAVRAWLDVCDGARVAGWAQDAEHPDGPVCLDILVDGTVVALALAQDHRADLAAAGMGDGRHGFDIDLDEPLARGLAHTVEVRRSADGLRVAALAVDAAGAWTALLAA